MDLLRAGPVLTGQTSGAGMLVDGGKCSALRETIGSFPDRVRKYDTFLSARINPMYRVGVA
ncbi:hypothetical protein Aple_023180 [Acrocarpospora pleiomorpha]|uniref:Uncharacterized protein n=1 Tax=Acrocarpospora pleiomorpha TaxID=90975 RepID=A0A5M3XFA6_9ACTN|nr:hypothetical protein Aple_023180 [Acrocarpospora pleiomorpha]